MKPFDYTDDELSKLALKLKDKNFINTCDHIEIVNGFCTSCLYKTYPDYELPQDVIDMFKELDPTTEVHT